MGRNHYIRALNRYVMRLSSINRPRATLRPSSDWSAIYIYLSLLILALKSAQDFHTALQISGITLFTVNVPNQYSS